MLDLHDEVEELWDEINNNIQQVLKDTRFILGPEVEAFEQETAEYLGVKHTIGVNSGTDALIISLRAAGIQPGDEVIVPSFTFYATPEAVSLVGATPVFADIDANTLNISPSDIIKKLSNKTKAIIPVHLFGRPADMDAILEIAQENNLKVIEDCAQSFGAKYYSTKNEDHLTGTLGETGAFSFFPSKNLGAYGDGGLITTNDDEIAVQARILRVHGSKARYHHENLGYNSRLDAIQAAILRVKLKHVDRFNEMRCNIAQYYNELLGEISEILVPEISAGHVFHQYTIRVPQGKRDALQQYLNENNISSAIYYPVPCHLQKVYRKKDIILPETEKAANEVLSLPIWPQMKENQLQRISDAIHNYFRN